MGEISGTKRPDRQEMPQISDRLTFLYLEHCRINRSDSAVTATNDEGRVYFPAAEFSCIMLGPGTNISHRAMELLGDTGVCIIWVGENGVRYYAHGRSLSASASLLIRQAKCVSNERLRLAVAKKMYQMRFPDEDISKLTMQQLRGKEGSRMRRLYIAQSRQWNVEWNGRDYDVDDFSGGSKVNQALSAGNACLYGLAHAVIVALGCAPGLGFVHDGLELSFVYDIADLYKAEITIPLAFELASADIEDIGREMRRSTRDLMFSVKLLEKMVADIKYLLMEDDEADESEVSLKLWDNLKGGVESGRLY